MRDDFVGTIDSDDDTGSLGESSRANRLTAKEEDFDPDFEFDFAGERQQGIDVRGDDEVKEGSKGALVSRPRTFGSQYETLKLAAP